MILAILHNFAKFIQKKPANNFKLKKNLIFFLKKIRQHKINKKNLMSNNIDDLLRDMDEVLNVSSPLKDNKSPKKPYPSPHQPDVHKSSSESPQKKVSKF